MLHICAEHVISAYLCRAYIISALHSSKHSSLSLPSHQRGNPKEPLLEFWGVRSGGSSIWGTIRGDGVTSPIMGHDSGAGLGIWETCDGISGSSTGSGSSVQWDQGYQERSLIAAQKLDFPKNQISKLKLKYLVLPFHIPIDRKYLKAFI